MYPEGNLFIPVAHGRLEAILKAPAQYILARGVALVCHPHPLGGGTMHNKVVFRAAAALNEAGLTVLRFNFRSVGLSTGTHDDGAGEQDDVRAALEFLSAEFPSQEITLAGFSFGARVGCEVGMMDARVVRLISIGTPVDKYDFSFLRQLHKPILFVHGERDEFGAPAHLRRLVDGLAADARASLTVVPDCGHFFENRLDQLKLAITDWLDVELTTNQGAVELRIETEANR